MNSSLLKEIWLFISAFGIMFAVLSWLQESSILSSTLGWLKGLFALLTGLFLYLIFRKSL
tara:strand:+ start:3766 stop:3945 length:180 start_codon:yes stop_codon:yes gene_type:complete